MKCEHLKVYQTNLTDIINLEITLHSAEAKQYTKLTIGNRGK